MGKFLRIGASPATAVALTSMNIEIDVRNVLPSIKVPALIIHGDQDRTVNIEHGKYLARHIPNAQLITIPTEDHLPWVGCPEIILDEVEAFLTGIRTMLSTDRVLSTLMFTDIVDSTKMAADLGDQKWKDLLETHDLQVRHELSIYRGREVDTAGDSFFASFDGPARALSCAKAIVESTKQLGLPVRIGIHTGECELRGKNLTGIAVHIAARISALAGSGQILVSRTVKDLVAGSGIKFTDFGSRKLKGVPEPWNIFEVI